MSFRIRFLGTGGGRYVTLTQLRRTAGFLIEDGDRFIHIDPGPGTAQAYKNFGENIRKVNTVFVSHAHIDHSLELPVVIEAMTEGLYRRRGTLILSRSVHEGLNGFRPISEDHVKSIENYHVVEPFQEVGPFLILPSKHTDPHTVGFLYKGRRTITYFGDTGYWKGMEDYARDIVIVNLSTLKELPSHASPSLVKKLVGAKLIILTGFGMSVLRYGPGRIGKALEKEMGVDIIVAYDGMEWGRGLSYFY